MAVEHIIDAGKRLDQLCLAPATSGNYSMRTDDDAMAITVSGAHKGFLEKDYVMRANIDGAPLEDKKPSAETLLHSVIYKIFPHVNAILHTHSVASTVLTRLSNDQALVLEGYEMLKAYPNINTHEIRIDLPVFNNTQDITALAQKVEKRLNNEPAFIIRAHGIYGWGEDMAEAMRVIEATEMMLSCELHMKQIQSNERKNDNEQINSLSGYAA